VSFYAKKLFLDIRMQNCTYGCIILTYVSNLVTTTCFWNNLHKKPKGLNRIAKKPKGLNRIDKKPKGLNRIDKIS